MWSSRERRDPALRKWRWRLAAGEPALMAAPRWGGGAKCKPWCAARRDEYLEDFLSSPASSCCCAIPAAARRVATRRVAQWRCTIGVRARGGSVDIGYPKTCWPPRTAAAAGGAGKCEEKEIVERNNDDDEPLILVPGHDKRHGSQSHAQIFRSSTSGESENIGTAPCE